MAQVAANDTELSVVCHCILLLVIEAVEHYELALSLLFILRLHVRNINDRDVVVIGIIVDLSTLLRFVRVCFCEFLFSFFQNLDDFGIACDDGSHLDDFTLLRHKKLFREFWPHFLRRLMLVLGLIRSSESLLHNLLC